LQISNGECGEQVSTSDQLTSYFCFPEADELQPMCSYQRWVVFYCVWRMK